MHKTFFAADFVGRTISSEHTLEHVNFIEKQAGTGPSRRHIQGSKIAKRLPSVKYSFTEVENRKFFENFFLKKLHTKKIGPSGALTSHNAEKLKGGTL